MSKYVSCFLMGGLGNQLFQLFATIAYSMKHKRKLIFPYADKLYTGTIRNTYWDSFLHTLKMYTMYDNKNHFTNDMLTKLNDRGIKQYRYHFGYNIAKEIKIPEEIMDILDGKIESNTKNIYMIAVLI